MSGREPPSLEKWRAWIDRLRDEVLTLVLHRRIWRTIIETAQANEQVPKTYVFNFMANTYSASQAMGIRRLCGDQAEEISFRNLLREIDEHPELIETRHVSPQQVKVDRLALDQGNLKKVRHYASQYLAHSQPVRPAPVPSFADLHAAIDDVGVLVRRYILMIEDADQMLEVPVLGDWMAPFRVAWLPPRGGPARDAGPVPPS